MATATQQTKPKLPDVEDAFERAQQAGQKVGTAYLDVYEKAIDTLTELQLRLADATKVPYLHTLAEAQAGVTRDVTKVQIAAARDLLG